MVPVAPAAGDVINPHSLAVFHQAKGQRDLLVVLHPLQFMQRAVRPA
jgi:hypothetical protein